MTRSRAALAAQPPATNRRSAPRVLGTGLVALDVVFGLDRNCAPGLFAGGTCANVMAALGFLGWEAYPVARLNGDAAAQKVRADLTRWGVRLDFARLVPEARTPVMIQRLRADSMGRVTHRFSVVCPDCGGWLPTYAPVPQRAMPVVLEAMPRPDVVFVDRLSPGAVSLAEAAYQAGALVYFEPSARSARPLFERMLAVAHVVKYSSDRAADFDALRPRHPVVPLEIETLGSRGLRYRGTMFGARSRPWRVLPSYPVAQLRDSAGAGDWCTAGILHALAQAGAEGFEGLPRDVVEDGLRLGQAYAAWTCGYEGPRGGMYRTDAAEFAAAITGIVERGQAPEDPWSPACDPPFDVFAELCGKCVDISEGRPRPTR